MIPFSLFDVQSDTLGNNGNATVAIEGARFTANTRFELFGTIDTIDYSQFATTTLIEDSTLAYATFDLLSLPAGLYSLRAIDGTESVVLADAITVQEGIGDDVVVLINGPTTVRPDRVVSIGLEYGNLGDQDAGAPLLLVTSASNTPMGFRSSELAAGPLHVFGASPDGPLDILRPGSTGTASILYNSQATVDVTIEPFTPADAEEITEDEWLEIEAAIRPAGLTNAQWNPYWADVQPRIGSTWGDYVGYLNRLVKELSGPGLPIHDVRSMMERAYLEIPDYRPGRTYTGQLVDETGAPVVGAQLALYRDGEFLTSRATTDSTGQYVLSFRDSGGYLLAVEAPYTWDIDQDGNVDFDAPQLTLDNSGDVTEASALHVERTLLDTRTQSNPVLTTDATGTAHLVFHREGQLWHSYFDGTNWVEGQVITDVPTYNLSVVADSQVIDGTDPGLIATWDQGLENETEIYYSVAKKEIDGSFTWSLPVQLTDNALQDADPTAIVAGGQLLTVYLTQNNLIQDDQDLYYELTDITTGGLSFPSFVFSVPEGGLLPAATTSKSAAFGWEKTFGPWNFLGAEFDAKAEFNGQVTAKCAPACELEAQAGGAFSGGVKLPSGNKIEGTGGGSIKGTWKADPTGTSWDFQGASLDANGSLSFLWDGGLTTVLGYMGPQGRAASSFITGVIDFAEWWFPSIDISEGIKFTGGVAFEGLGWSGSAPFPNFILPDSVQKASVSGSVGPYLKVANTSGSVEASVSGNVSVAVQVYPAFKIGPISGTVSAGAVVHGWQYGPASFQISVLNSLGGDGLSPSDTDVPFVFNPAAALGSANVYGTNSVLSSVATDLTIDSAPVLGQAGSTTYLGWIADGDPTASTPEIGSFIKVADFNGTGFDAPQTLPGSLGFNRYLQTGVDASGNRIAVWSMADSTGLGASTTLEELQAAMRDTDVVYSVFDGTSWSTPSALPTTPGTDAALSLDTTAEGDLLLTWSTHDETNGYRLMSHRWNDATNTFGAATVIATGDQISDTEVGVVGGKTTVFWTVDTDPDAEVTLKNIFSSTFESGSWSAPQEFAPQIAISAVAQASQLYSENFLQSLPDFPVAFASIAETLRGDVLAAWGDGPELSDGSTEGEVLVSLYKNGSWSPAAAVPGSYGVNREVTAATNVAGDLLVLWLSVQDDGDATILSSVYREGYWSSPVEVARTGGDNSEVRIGLDSLSGNLVASWISEDAHGTHLLSSMWDGLWSDARAIATGDDLANGFVSIDDGETIVTWNADGQTHSSRLENATWTPAALATQAQMAAGALAMSDMFLVPSILAGLGTSNLAPLANSFRLLPVPEDCKKCDKLEEIRRGSGECGYKVEFDEKNCKRITYYKPCVVRPSDPNDILGPDGFGEQQWISASDVYDYTIRFENQPTATAAAQEVVITQQFDEDLNPAKFKIGAFGFRNMVFDAPNKPFHFQQIDLTEEFGVFVTLSAVVDLATNTATWTFRTIDPSTGQPPQDASLGFLPINDETGVGEGFVSYTIEADANVPTGTVIDAEAVIVFDTEEPIATPPIFNTLDADAPTSSVTLESTELTNEFIVSWAGEDPNDGSGIAVYDVFVSTDGEGYVKWLAATELTEATYVGELGTTYEFYSVAIDNANNSEPPPETADETVTTPGGQATIGNRVWNDLDFNGLQDELEPGVEGVVVSLFIDDGGAGTFVASDTTDADGLYSFPELEIDVSYFLSFDATTLPSGFAFTDSNAGGDEAIDSDVDIATGLTSVFTVVNGDNLDWDAGIVALASVGGTVWNDLNGDTIRDSGEPGLADWTVYIDVNDNGQLDDGEPAQQSGSDGQYSFTDLRPGIYVIAEVIKDGWIQTHPGESGASSFNSGSSGYAYSGRTTQVQTPGETVDGAGVSRAGELIGLDDFWADPRFNGVSGGGYSVVVIDTGIDVNHGFFGADADGNGIADRIVYQYDFADNDADASDFSGHGSHVTSVIASEDANYPGIAPDANIIHLKVFSDSGVGYFSYVEQALAWVIQNVDQYNIAAVNMSIGDGLNWDQARGLHGIGDELAALSELDVITVAAAGNAYGYFGNQGVAYPAADPNTIAVGAVWDSNRGGPWSFGANGVDYTTGADHITSFSQRDTDLLDVFAPGALITAANAFGSVTTMRGTSMATPFVTGAAVLAQQLAVSHLGRQLSSFEFRHLLDVSGALIFDGDDEQDNVANTHSNYFRIDMVALGTAVLAYDGSFSDGDNGGSGNPGSGGVGPANGGPFRYTVELAPGQNRDNVDFGNQVEDSVGPEVSDVIDVTPDPRTTAVSSVDVTFNEAIDLSTFDFSDISLTRGGVNVPLSGAVTTSLVSGTTYRIDGLAAFTASEGAYVLTVLGAGIEDMAGNAGTTNGSDAWAVDHTPGTSKVDPLPTVQTSLTFAVSATGTDPTVAGASSGIASYEIYRTVQGAAWELWTTVPASNPVAQYTATSNQSVGFYSIAIDAVGNREVKTPKIEAGTYIPDLDAPTTQVDSVDETDAPTLTINFSGSDAGGTGLASFQVYVSIDGATPTLIQQVGAGLADGSGIHSRSIDYEALADGNEHTYRFFTVGYDQRGNVEAAPAAPADVQITRTFEVPTEFFVSSFDVQKGAIQRSYLRYVDVTFSLGDQLQAMVNSVTDGDATNDRIALIRRDLDGTSNPTPIGLSSVITVAGQKLEFDFGPNGIGGNRNSNVGDGYYTLQFDLDSDGDFTDSGETLMFYRLLGNVDADTTVTQADVNAILGAFGSTGTNLEEDANGDGVVNQIDRILAIRALGRGLGGGLPLSSFSPSFLVTNFDVQKDAVQRSFVQYLDVTFNQAAPLGELIATVGDGDATNDRVRLERYELDGSGSGEAVDLSNRLSATDKVMEVNFGEQGIGGDRNSNIGDGYYKLLIDTNGDGDFDDDGEIQTFYRLLGDVDGNRRAEQADVDAVLAAFGTTGPFIDEDVNGDGVVNQIDRILAIRALGRQLDGNLPLSD
ncbi:MAG: SdrD B-like domain-containing protein [Pirellulaceae bacterium]